MSVPHDPTPVEDPRGGKPREFPPDHPPHMSPARSSWQRTARSFRYAGAGIVFLFRTQPNARVHGLAMLLALAMAAWLGVGATTWAILLLCTALVISLEAMNTAVEAVVDLACPTFHPLAKIAKDCAAAAVLIAALGAFVVGLVLLGPPLWERTFG